MTPMDMVRVANPWQPVHDNEDRLWRTYTRWMWVGVLHVVVTVAMLVIYWLTGWNWTPWVVACLAPSAFWWARQFDRAREAWRPEAMSILIASISRPDITHEEKRKILDVLMAMKKQGRRG